MHKVMYASSVLATIGLYLIAVMKEIFCIVEGGQSQAHPFRRVRDAVAGSEEFTTTHSPWTNRCELFTTAYPAALTGVARLHVTYRRLIPAIEASTRVYVPTYSSRLTPSHALQIEILPAGEAGPRHLDDTTVMKIQGLPFLTISEFIRAKLKSWIMCAFFSCEIDMVSNPCLQSGFRTRCPGHMLRHDSVLEPRRHQSYS